MNCIQHLKELHLKDNRIKYPSLPECARVAPVYNDRDANGLTRCIIDYIRLTGGQAERISCQGRYIDNTKIVNDVTGHIRRIGSGKWIKASMTPGTSDLSAVIRGQAIKIEVKIGRDKQSKAQKQYQQQVEAAGGVYFIATSFEQFFNWYENELDHG